ncbi:hypothetical protein COU88_02540 [Candidatus Roizmanbacteria bacterium CG10_big_fil_rev_8_21_14_0_10_39_6]|uniref:Uncharacterized protein n=1 Tax=Candidatus Roizmanbacteria bacterium CG10_big_fil_rev_8_21_14_0_10_39_6 TaxID=1974853 RepID=A0A2M8KSJ8_9BACT|nr:MAG: hypothetical protein COU88_02540 [Candidatus Roizmanbacteria bacterium CG10_big_fil_rev_8_21_14_0_10_39_6]
MKKLAVLIFILVSVVFITKQAISPVIAEEACYVNFLSSTKWLTQNTALIDIGADGYTGEEPNTIEIKYGNNNWISIVRKDKCDTDPNKSEVPYNNDTCMDKVSGGHFQFGITADQQTQTYTPDYQITVRINCGASKTINFPPPPPPPTIAPTVAPTPLPAGVTQYVTSVCLEPYIINDTSAGCPADYKIINNWSENGLVPQCYDWNYENVLYSHVLQLRSKIALNKNFPAEIFRRTTLQFEGNNDTNQTATWCAADKNYGYACNIA